MSVLASRKTFLERTELDMGSSFFVEAETRKTISIEKNSAKTVGKILAYETLSGWFDFFPTIL